MKNVIEYFEFEIFGTTDNVRKTSQTVILVIGCFLALC